MDWNHGFSAQYSVKRVDPVSFGDIGSFDLTAGSITKEETGLIESASLTLKEYPGECWIRVYLEARQTSGGARVPIFTGLTSAPTRALDGLRESWHGECYSVLKPASDILLLNGYYVAAGMDGAQAAAGLLNTGPAPVVYEGGAPRLSEAIISESGETRLTMAHKILDAIGWRIRLDGDGTIRILPAADEPAAQFDMFRNDMIEPRMTVTEDWFSCPNCFRAVSGTAYAAARDDDPASPLSTVSRGREIWMEESVILNDSESIGDMAVRRLKELQAHAMKVDYSRRFRQEVTVGDLVRLHYPNVRIDGVFRVSTQTLTLGYGCTVQEGVIELG